MYQLAQCSHCPTKYQVDLAQLARQASRWACPVCGVITDFAERQIQKPATSPQDKQAWAALGIAALFVGLLMFADRVT
jgi:PHP family Zn ribbon phosphoesterase